MNISYTAYGYTASNNNIAFNGDYKINGLYLTGSGYRLYNPRFRRFYSPDKLFPLYQAGMNPYTMVKGDTINYIDPTGLMPVHQVNYNAILADKNNLMHFNNHQTPIYRLTHQIPSDVKINGFQGHEIDWVGELQFFKSIVYASDEISGISNHLRYTLADEKIYKTPSTIHLYSISSSIPNRAIALSNNHLNDYLPSSLLQKAERGEIQIEAPIDAKYIEHLYSYAFKSPIFKTMHEHQLSHLDAINYVLKSHFQDAPIKYQEGALKVVENMYDIITEVG